MRYYNVTSTVQSDECVGKSRVIFEKPTDLNRDRWSRGSATLSHSLHESWGEALCQRRVAIDRDARVVPIEKNSRRAQRQHKSRR